MSTSPATTVPPVVQHNSDLIEDQFADMLFNVKSDVHDVSSEIGNKIKDGTKNLLSSANEIANSLQLAHSAWLLGLHQVLLFFLVLGRWMLPRGGIRCLIINDNRISG